MSKLRHSQFKDDTGKRRVIFRNLQKQAIAIPKRQHKLIRIMLEPYRFKLKAGYSN